MNILCINIEGALFQELYSVAVKFNVKLFPLVFSDAIEPKIKAVKPNYIFIDFMKNAEHQEGEKIYQWMLDKKLPYPIIAVVGFLDDLKAMRMLRKKPQIDYVLEKPFQKDQLELLFETLKQPEEVLNPKIKELYHLYDKTLFEKLDILCELNQKLKQNPSVEALLALRAEVHKIAGSAGSYGYSAASAGASQLQDKLEALSKDFGAQKCNVDKEIQRICFDLQFRKNDPVPPPAPIVPVQKPAAAVSEHDILNILKGKAVPGNIPKPVHILSKEGIKSGPPQKPPTNPKMVTLTKKDVVIVDDDQSALNYVKEVFSVFGFNVHCFNSGPSGLEFLMRCNDLQSCCMVILDLEMPEIDGFSILKKLKAKFGNVRVVFLSSKYSQENEEEAKKYGAFDFIKKPFNSSVMKEILKHKA